MIQAPATIETALIGHRAPSKPDSALELLDLVNQQCPACGYDGVVRVRHRGVVSAHCYSCGHDAGDWAR